jgi:aspartate/methionine/tyrosine aminotransferase
MANVVSPVIPIIAELIRANPGTISLGQGVVHWHPPKEALDAAAKFARGGGDGKHLYTPVVGTTPLVDALENKLWQHNKIKVTPASRIVVTAGANMGFQNAILAITDPGDEIILNAPYYFNHQMAVALADCRTVVVPTDENYQLQPDLIRDAITDRTRAVVTISPNNPTGAVYSSDLLYEVNQLCRDAEIYHISDEAYEYFTYAGGARHFSPGAIAEAADYTISLFSLSKSYGFASWRIGYMVIPEHLLTSIRKIQDTILICPPAISQAAAMGALSAPPDFIARHVATLAPVRDMVQSALKSVGDFVEVPPSDGAFYFFIRVLTDIPAMAVAEHLIRTYKIAVIPGETFGAGLNDGRCYLRIAYGALSPETVHEGMDRLTRGLKEALT